MKRDRAGFVFAFAFLLVYCAGRLAVHYSVPILDYFVDVREERPAPVTVEADRAPQNGSGLSAHSRELCRRTAIGARVLLHIKESWLTELE